MSPVTQETTETFLKAPLEELIFQADGIRRQCAGPQLELCSILNAKSGRCSEDCRFCAQSARHHAKISVYPLKTKEEIVEAARGARDIGAGRFGIVTSGNRLTNREVDVIARAISEITEGIGISVCASLGAMGRRQLGLLRAAGLSRYHHNIETSRRFYPRIVSTHSFDDRIETINCAKEVGLEVCSGGIVGMGESWADRIEMACTLKELDVESVPVNILVPIEGTALERAEPVLVEDVIRTICIFRIILRDKTIKVAAGREAVLKDSQIRAFAAGANGMLIGGYLTIRGASLAADYALVKEIKKIWAQ